MKRKIFSLVLVFVLIVPIVFVFTGCNLFGFFKHDNNKQSRLYNVYNEPDTFWVEYSSYSTNNSRNLYSFAKVTETNRTLYYAYYTNAGANHKYFIVLNNDESFTVYYWDYQNQTWTNHMQQFNENYNGTGTPTWFDFQTSYLSGYMSMALSNLSYGLSKSNKDIEYKGTENFELSGTINTNAETIEAEHYYNSKFDEDFYFAKDSNVVLQNLSNYDLKAKVFKLNFDMQDVLSEHNETIAGLEAIFSE